MLQTIVFFSQRRLSQPSEFFVIRRHSIPEVIGSLIAVWCHHSLLWGRTLRTCRKCDTSTKKGYCIDQLYITQDDASWSNITKKQRELVIYHEKRRELVIYAFTPPQSPTLRTIPVSSNYSTLILSYAV